jgi:hypothetical protein
MNPDSQIKDILNKKGMVKAPAGLLGAVEKGIRHRQRKRRFTLFSAAAAVAAMIAVFIIIPLSMQPLSSERIASVEAYLEETFDAVLAVDTSGTTLQYLINENGASPLDIFTYENQAFAINLEL